MGSDATDENYTDNDKTRIQTADADLTSASDSKKAKTALANDNKEEAGAVEATIVSHSNLPSVVDEKH